MDRFEITGIREDGRLLYVDVAYKDTASHSRALDALIPELRRKTGVKPSRLGSGDAQRYEFEKLLVRVLQFADEGNFEKAVPYSERQRRLRALAKTLNGALADILERQRHRKVATLSFRRPEDSKGLLQLVRKVLKQAG